ncbi:hypothetical protein [Mycobacterium canetti]|uniref:hypothetical protein n=1 Tax=Mycobacterium canetti TaxID=78331 RepID=UPI0002EA9B5A|nr:hypothetical protein [Mycobacterium canetti]
MTTTETAFDAIIAAFDAIPSCEVRTPGGHCSNPAWWYASFHGCGNGLMCTWHLKVFLRQGAGERSVECNRCGSEFAGIEQAVTLVAL